MKAKSESEVAQSYPTLSNPMDCSLPGSSVHGIFQARVLECGAIAFSAQVVLVERICLGDWRSPVQKVKEMKVQSLDQGDPLEKEMATHSSILAWNFIDRGAWRNTDHGGGKELDMTE